MFAKTQELLMHSKKGLKGTTPLYRYAINWAFRILVFWQEHYKNFYFKCKTFDLFSQESVDFILHHPSYADIIKYSEWKIPEDLSNIHDIDEFADEMEKIARECFRVLKKWQYCAILIGDTRREKMYQPMAFKVMERFLRVGFALKEDIVKVQHNCKATGYWKTSSQKYNFLLIMHEHLFIFKKL